MDELRRLAIEVALWTLNSKDAEDAPNIELARQLLTEAGLAAGPDPDAETPPSPPLSASV